MIARLLSVALLLMAGPAAAQTQKGGTLIIAGGAIAPDNAEIVDSMFKSMPDNWTYIAVIASASSEPQASFESFRDYLVRHGMDENRIRLVRIAMKDDPATKNIDESKWAGNANSLSEIDIIQYAGIIWFTGGDQTRTTRLLLAADGKDTPMLSAIRKRLAVGAVVGGSSAGAAIMGKQMIACGDADGAPAQPISNDITMCEDTADNKPTPLVITRGLGFLPWAITDQHFSQRRRLLRLKRAVVAQPKGQRVGYGIDENSALLVRPRLGTMSLISGRATIIVKPKGQIRETVIEPLPQKD